MKIVIELNNEDVEEINIINISHLLMDALYEYRIHRGPTPEAYVARRYPDGFCGDKRNDAQKIEDVRSNCELSSLIHGSCSNVMFIE